MISLYENIKGIFIGGVFTEEFQERENGGPECDKYMSNEFKLIVTVIAVSCYYLIFNNTLKKLQKEIVSDTKGVKNPSFLDLFFGYLSIIVFFCHCAYKFNSGQLIFMLNPCHIVGIVQAYLLISPSKLTERTIYTVVMNTLFSPWIAVIFPTYTGLHGKFEVLLFWVEHILCAIINPLVLSLSHRYYSKSTISIRNHIFSHVLFGFYQRLVLFPISKISLANLNFTLCPTDNDPFEPFLGKWYYVVSEAYIFIGGEIFHRIVKILLEIVKKIEGLIFKHSHNADMEKRD